MTAPSPRLFDVRATVRRYAPDASERMDGTTFDLPDGSTLCLGTQGWVLLRGLTATPLHSLAQLRQSLGARVLLVPGSCGPLLTTLGGGAVASTHEPEAQRDLRRLGLLEPHPRHPGLVRLNRLGIWAAEAIASCAELDLLVLNPRESA